MKGSTNLRRFCWLQINFSYGHCPDSHFGASNGSNWPVAAIVAGGLHQLLCRPGI